MKGLEYRDTRMTFELFRLKDPSCAERPWQNPEPEVEVVLDFKASTFQEAGQITKHWNIHHPEAVHYWRHKRSRYDFGLWHEDGICSWGLSDVDNYFVDKVATMRKQLRELDDKELNSTEKEILHLKILRNRRIQILRKIGKMRKLSVNKFIRMLVKFRFAISDWCGWWLKDFWADKFRDLRWWFKKTISLHRTGHSPDEWWTLELHLLETLKFNLKRLIEDGVSINSEFVKDALAKRHGSEAGFDLDAAMKEFSMGKDYDEVEKEAIELQNQTYARICHLADLYTFYFNQEVDDKDIYEHPELRTPDMRELYLEGSYDELDYKAMADRGTECWNEIWDLVKRYGQQMGD